MSNEGIATIRVKTKTRDRLQTFGTYKDTMDDIINKALDVYEKEKP